MIPLVQYEVVEHYRWMSLTDFNQVLALAYALPGPIATKMAGYVGYSVAGWPGAVVALLGISGPTVLAMGGLFALINRFRDSDMVIGITRAVEPVVIVLLLLLVYDVARHVFSPEIGSAGSGGAAVHPAVLIGLMAVSLVLLQGLHLHPVWVIAGAIVIGALFLRPA